MRQISIGVSSAVPKKATNEGESLGPFVRITFPKPKT